MNGRSALVPAKRLLSVSPITPYVFSGNKTSHSCRHSDASKRCACHSLPQVGIMPCHACQDKNSPEAKGYAEKVEPMPVASFCCH